MTSSQLDGHDSDIPPETYVKAGRRVTTLISTDGSEEEASSILSELCQSLKEESTDGSRRASSYIGY